MEDSNKKFRFANAMWNLKPDVGFAFSGEYPMTEEKYATIEWVTGENENGIAITTTVNPYSELTWEKVNAEMTRLQTEYEANEYARKRKDEYPTIEELVVALYDSEDRAAVDEKRATVKLKYPKP
jgi:hypothetical protein